MEGGEFGVPTAEVVRTAIGSGCTAYDCEFVVLARDLGVRFFLRKPVDDQALLDAISWVVQEDAA